MKALDFEAPTKKKAETKKTETKKSTAEAK